MQRAAFAVHAAALIATPLRRRGRRAGLAVTVVVSLCTATAAACVRRWGAPRTTVGVGIAVLERVGTSTGVPFGRYRYTGALRPSIGGVPAVVPLAWFAMAVPARDPAHAALGPRSSRLRRIAAPEDSVSVAAAPGPGRPLLVGAGDSVFRNAASSWTKITDALSPVYPG